MIQKNDTVILKAEKKHIKYIAQIENECFSRPWTEKSIEESFINGNSTFLIAQKDGKFIGYAGFYIVLDEVYLYNIAVVKKFRHMNIGNLLMKKIIDTAKDSNAAFVSLEVRISNTDAVKLYKKHGFENAGIRKNFYSSPKEDALIMTRRL